MESLALNTKTAALDFLSRGGEVAEHIRSKDWSETLIGTPDTWPQSLRSALSICMNSNSPTAIYWGKELTLLYNDAWISIPGNKNPTALGRAAKEVWPEIWHVIEPEIQKAFNGEFGSAKNTCLPIQRPHTEESYFDFTFTPLYGESGKVAGVFSTITQATERINNKSATSLLKGVLTSDKIEASEEKFRNLVTYSPVAMTVLKEPSHIIEIANERALELWGKTHEQVINLPALKAMPELAEQGFGAILDEVYSTGKPFIANELPVTLIRHGKSETLYINFIYEPLRNSNGAIEGIVGIGIDVSEQVIARKKIEESEGRYHDLIHSSPSAIAILKGEEFIVSVANETILKSWGKGKDIIGKPLLSIMPEIINQGFGELLQHVFATGEPYYGHETPVQLLRNGRWELVFYNFVYQAQRNNKGEIEGLAIISNEVTPQALLHKKVEESEEQFRIAIDGGELGTYDFYLQTGKLIWSPKTKEFFGLPPEAEVNFDTFLKGLHPDDKERSHAAIEKAMDPKNGGIYEDEYRSIGITDGKLRWIRSKGKISFDTEGKPVRFTGVIQEITQQKELIRSLQLQSLVLKRMDEGVSVSDENGLILFTNAAEDEMFGYETGELIGKHVTVQNAYPQQENERIVNAVISDLKQNGFWSGEWHNRKKDSSLFYTFSFITQIEIDGAVLFVCVQRDISEEKAAKEKLAYRTALLEAQNEAIPDAILIVDTKGKMLSFNQHFIELWKIPEEILKRKDDAAALQFAMTQLADPEGFIERVNYCYAHPGEKVREEVLFKDSRIIERYGNAVTGEDGTSYGWAWYFRDITEQKKAEEEIRASEERFRNFVNNSENLGWMADSEGWIYWYNQRWHDYTGATLEEMQGWGWGKVHHPDHLERVVAYVKEAWQTGQPYELTFPLKRKDGAYRWFLTRIVPIKNAEGKVYRWIGTNTDIHEQKLAEERFRTLAETLPQLVWMTDTNGEQFYASSRWKEYTGIESQGWETWQQSIHPDDITGISKAWDSSLASGTLYKTEARLKNKEGTYRWHFVQGEPIKDDEGKITKWIGAFTDIHDQKTFAAQLEKLVAERTKDLVELNKLLEERNTDLFDTQNFLQTVLDSSVELVSSLDTDLRYTFVNKKVEDFLTREASDIIGKLITEIHPGIENTTNYQHLQKALSGETIHIEQRESLSRNETILETYMFPLMTGDKITGVIVLQRDVTSFIQLSEKLRQSNLELERSNDDLQQFAHVASHDLKEPVRKIKTFSSRFEDEFGTTLTETGKLYLDKVQTAADRMFAMIEGVLNYSTINTLDQGIETIALAETLQNITNDLEILIGQKGAVITCNNLPQIEGIPVLIHQLFYNLINNSLKFSRTDVQPKIWVDGKTERRPGVEMVVITVADNGIGFDQVHAEKIFNTFARLNSKDKYEGTGLGLSLCRKIVERHGGNITATGKKDEGSVFTISLPVKQKGIV